MYEAGQTVVYGKNGVCLIEGISAKKIGSETIEYYVLRPLMSQVSTVLVPVGNETLVEKIKPVHTADEITQILENPQEIAEWNSNKFERTEQFTRIISRGNLQELINLIRLLRYHEKDLIKRGKHLNLSDERTLKDSEKMACGEIAVVFGTDKKEALEMILKHKEN